MSRPLPIIVRTLTTRTCSILRRLHQLGAVLNRWLRRFTWINYFILLLSIVISASAFYGASFLVDLLYDPEVAAVISRKALILIIVIPSLVVCLSLGILIKIISERITKQPGTSLRFKIISFFAFAFLLPPVLFLFLFTQLFNFAIANTIGNPLLSIKLEAEILRHQRDLQILQTQNEATLLRLLASTNTQPFARQAAATDIDLILNFNAQMALTELYKRPAVTLKNYPTFNFAEELPNNASLFSSYEAERGFVYTLYQAPITPSGDFARHRLAAITFIAPTLKNEINSTFQLLSQVKQFELLIHPFRSVSIILLLYLHIQIFSIVVIIFYYRSNRYLTPLGELIRTLQDPSELTQTSHAPSGTILKHEERLAGQIKRLEGNEIGELLRAFQQMRRQLRRNRRHMEQVLELRGWKTAATQLAHEIKNPLTPILLSLSEIKNSLIRKDFLLYESLNDAFNLIEGEITRIAKLLNDFAVFSTESALVPKTFRSDILFDKLRLHLRNYPSISTEISPSSNTILYADEDKIYRTLINLVQNAIEALESSPQLEKNLTINAQEVMLDDHRYFEVKVCDNGPGIAPAIRDTLFNPHRTTKKTGTGIGLAICKQIALAHEGDVFVLPSTTPHNHWTTIFVLRFPLNLPPSSL